MRINAFTWLALVAVCVCTAPRSQVRAQQNLFNVPSGISTRPGHAFLQQQLNLTGPLGTSCTTLDIGVTSNFELGVNVNNVTLYDRTNDLSATAARGPSLLVNAQRGISFGERDQLRLSLGSQTGVSQGGQGQHTAMDFSWAMGSVELPRPGARMFAGAYYANRALGGRGFPVGGLLGIEVPLVRNRVSMQADYVSGDREISVAVVGLVIELPADMQVSIGIQLPTLRSEAPVGLVVELTQRGFPLRALRSRPEAIATRKVDRI
ncbi:MAG: hypothetical protein JWN48_3516 [Myxococcaceae bacterium]|nr:hypothetical protein [Myxococcaceae bacterium]